MGGGIGGGFRTPLVMQRCLNTRFVSYNSSQTTNGESWFLKDPVPLIEKRRGLSPGGRFPPSVIHPVIIITGLNKL